MLRHTYDGMTDSHFDEINAMLRNVFLPVMDAFYGRKAYTKKRQLGVDRYQGICKRAILLGQQQDVTNQGRQILSCAKNNGTMYRII